MRVESASKKGRIGSKKMGKGFINTGMGHRKMAIGFINMER